MEKIMRENIVIKIGSSVLVTEENTLDEVRISRLAEQIVALQRIGFAVVLVVSGAVAVGSQYVDISPQGDLSRRAAAGIGQVYLSDIWNKCFSKYGVQLGQILVMKDSLKKTLQKNQLQKLMNFYTERNIIPLINENDVMELNGFGGNDLLATEISALIQAKTLLILSTMKGSTYGVGGGQTKQDAIQILRKVHISTTILNGKAENILLQTLL